MSGNRARAASTPRLRWGLRGAAAAAGLLLGAALAAPARADVVILDDGTELRGQVVMVGSMVQVHQFDGVRSVPRHRVAAMATRDLVAPRAADSLDPDGLFAQALAAEARGDHARAESLRRLAGERELYRRAARLGPDDDEGWTRLTAFAAVMGLDLAHVRVLRAEARAQGSLALAEPEPSPLAYAVEASLDDELDESDSDDPEAELAWRPRRSALRGPSAPVVVIIPGRERAAEPYCEPRDRYIRGVGGRPGPRPPPEPRPSLPSLPGGETFRAASSARTTFEALTGQRATTFGAAHGEGHRTFRGISGR
jgi:hypothetical protein